MVPILSKEGKGGYNEKDVILNFYTPAGEVNIFENTANKVKGFLKLRRQIKKFLPTGFPVCLEYGKRR